MDIFFDVSQTDGDPLPDPVDSLPDLPLVEVARGWNIDLTSYNGRSGQALGHYGYSDQRKVIALAVENLSTWTHDQLIAQNKLIAQLVDAANSIAHALAPSSPNFRRDLTDFPGFDWSSIDAQVIHQDAQGPTIVQWAGHRFTRHAGNGKFGDAIWYSRPLGRTDDGTEYARLITFKDYDPAASLPADLAPAAPKRKPSAKDNPHLKYGDGSEVPYHNTTIALFNAFLAEKQRKPKDAGELSSWYDQSKRQ